MLYMFFVTIFVTKCNNTLFGTFWKYLLQKVSQGDKISRASNQLLKIWQGNMTGITKCGSYYKMICNPGYFHKIITIDGN